jgi:glutaminase
MLATRQRVRALEARKPELLAAGEMTCELLAKYLPSVSWMKVVEHETGGKLASYIPELAKVDPDLLAVAACTVDGEVASVGDDRHELTLQSLSKPFVYGRALELLGPEAVRARLGVEPSGDPFDAIIQLDGKNRPHNPMINAGAIAAAGILVEHGESIADLLGLLPRYAGRALTGVNAPVYLSERTAGHRNRAIASLLRNFRLVDDEAAALELYFQRCSIRVTCAQLARMGAALAGGGVQPVTGQRVLPPELARNVLAVMLTCGLHDESGRFAFDVGLPAKTGISGGIVAVVPGRMGLAVYSPPVNEHGSSVRGLTALETLSRRLDLSVFGPGRALPANAMSGSRNS